MKGGLSPGLGLAILRVVIGVIFIVHGWPKLFGGLEGTAAELASAGVPLSGVAAWAVAVLETVGGVLVVVGAFFKPATALLALRATAGLLFGGGAGSGRIELDLLLAAGLITLILAGPGYATLRSRRQAEILVA